MASGIGGLIANIQESLNSIQMVVPIMWMFVVTGLLAVSLPGILFPFPDLVRCGVAGVIAYITFIIVWSGANWDVAAFSWKRALWIGVIAGAGCVIGGMVPGYPLLSPVLGGIGAAIGYRLNYGTS